MTGYLVIRRHEMDDLPLRLFPNIEAAREYVTAETLAEARTTDEKATCALLRTDCTTPVCYAIVGFDRHGRPTSCEIID